VPAIRLDFGKPTECSIEDMTLAEAQRHFDDGQFPPGSMGPKVAAAMKFVRGATAGGCPRMAAVTTPELVYGTLAETSGGIIEGSRGTRILPNPVEVSHTTKENA